MPRLLLYRWFLAISLACILGSAATEYRQRLPELDWRNLTEAELANWRDAGWRIEAEALPAGWTPLGRDGSLEVLTDGLRFTGQLTIPGLRFADDNGWVVVAIEARNGAVSLAGPVFGGPRCGQLGWLVSPEVAGGGEWRNLTTVCHAAFPANAGASLRLFSRQGVEVRAVTIHWHASPLDAYRQAFEQFERPLPNLVRNGDFEETERLLPEDIARWRDKGWDLGEGDTVLKPKDFGPNAAWNDRVMRLIQDRQAAYRGQNCIMTDLVTGGNFSAHADRQYVFSIWARGEGSLAVFCHTYGGEKGGFLGNVPVVAAGTWQLGPDWSHYQVTVPLQIAGYDRVGALPVLTVSGGLAWLDDFAVYELDTAATMLTSLARQKARLRETLEDQVEIGPRQRQLVNDLLTAAAALAAAVHAGELSTAVPDRVAALEYITPRIKSVIDFGDILE